MIRVLDIPGVPAIENRARLNSLAGVRQDFELERMVDLLIFKTLGFETRPEWLILDRDRDESTDDWVERMSANDDEVDDVEWWAERGWDIRGDEREILACFDLLEDSLICLEDGLGGVGKMQLEAKIWADRKAEETSRSSRSRSQDRAFLNLAQNRRRRA